MGFNTWGFISPRGGSGKSVLVWIIASLLSIEKKVGVLEVDFMGFGMKVKTFSPDEDKFVTKYFLNPHQDEEISLPNYYHNIDPNELHDEYCGRKIDFKTIKAFFTQKCDNVLLEEVENLYQSNASTKYLDHYLFTLIDKIKESGDIEYLLIDFPGYFRNPIPQWFRKFYARYETKFSLVTNLSPDEVMCSYDFISNRADNTSSRERISKDILLIVNKYFDRLDVGDTNECEQFGCSCEARVCQKRRLLNSLAESSSDEIKKALHELECFVKAIREEAIIDKLEEFKGLVDPVYLKLADAEKERYKKVKTIYFPESHYISLSDKIGRLCINLDGIAKSSRTDEGLCFTKSDAAIFKQALETLKYLGDGDVNTDNIKSILEYRFRGLSAKSRFVKVVQEAPSDLDKVMTILTDNNVLAKDTSSNNYFYFTSDNEADLKDKLSHIPELPPQYEKPLIDLWQGSQPLWQSS